ncbi:MAG: replication-relaxation family protein [Planctomycetes bacterium]|nr:replication-relaxation family protein [Planctomycetota bacterium]
MLTPRDIGVLVALDTYYLLNRPQIQSLLFVDDKNGRITRRRLQALVDAHLICRQSLLYCQNGSGAPASVYHLSRKGAEFLAEHFENPEFNLSPTSPPPHHLILHWLAISDTHILLNQALALRGDIRKESWINEYDVVNKDEAVPEKRFQLYTLIRETPRLICAPDAGFELSMEGYRKAFYLEQDRATSGVQQIANSKTPGYAAMAEHCLHRRHFPQTNLDGFTVLMVTPSPKRRDNLRKAIAAKPCANLWLFSSTTELTPESFLNGPVWYPCDGMPRSLIRRKEAS